MLIDDLDGDGWREVLMVTIADVTEHCRLRVFNHDGSVRFEIQPDRTMRFGDGEYAPPYAVSRFIVTTEADGTKAIWITANHEQWFPSVVQKLTPDGQVLAEFWTNGHSRVLLAAEVAGRPVILLGGISNDTVGATLTVLDRARPGGSVPSLQDEFACRNCPAGGPLAMLVFPRTEVNRVLDGSRPMVWNVKPQPGGGWEVEVILAEFEVPGGGLFRATSYYTLTSDLRPIGASVEDDYRRMHVTLQVHGLLDHPFAESETGQLWPVLSWNGERFEEIRPPAGQR